jgi:ABC-type dipeptide/oligopeptide/nickel transport system permease subunit
MAIAAGALLGIFIIAALFPDFVGRVDPLKQTIGDRLTGPSWDHWFGTDELGRDIYSRVVHGTRTSLTVSLVAVLVSLVLGVPLGLLGGYAGGWSDDLISRAMDLLVALPGILVAMTLIAVLGRSPTMVAVVLGLVSTPVVMRITRAVVLQAKNLPYVMAVRSAGATPSYIATRTILPNASADLFTQSLLTAAHAVVVEAGLSFLGLGMPPPNPSWGTMLQTSARYTHQAWWYGVFPGLTLVLLILSFQLLARANRASE